MSGPCSNGDSNWGTDSKPEDFVAAVGEWTPDPAKYTWKGWKKKATISAGDISYFNVLDFGVLDDADDALRIGYAIEAALVSGVGAVFLPRRTYIVRSPIVVKVTAGQSLRIFSEFATLLVDSTPSFKWNSSEPMLTLSSDSRPLSVERLHLNAMWKAPSCLLLSGFNGPAATMRNVSAQFGRVEGIRVLQSKAPSIWDCTADHNRGDGWSIVGCNGGSFIGCVARYNRGSGFSICGSSGDWFGGCFLSHFQSEENGGSGVCIWDGDPAPKDGHATGVRVRDGWVEGNHRNGVRIAAWDVDVSGLKIVPGGDDYTENRCIWVDKEASGVIIRDCVASSETKKVPYFEPYDGAGQARYVFFDHNYTTGSESFSYGSVPCSPDPSRAGLIVPKP